jgi:hypothetical protein
LFCLLKTPAELFPFASFEAILIDVLDSAFSHRNGSYRIRCHGSRKGELRW